MEIGGVRDACDLQIDLETSQWAAENNMFFYGMKFEVLC